ncbi:MAG: radical SAM protein, partial [Actinomycetota bacterium]|nr:radical SAM protein [Actinomycetota bacterium]
MEKDSLNPVIISDAWGYGLLETKPHPLWQVRYAAIRNKALLVPEYGAMYIAAFLKKHGWEPRVLNLVADVFREESWFREREEGLPDDFRSTAPVGGEEALALMRKNLEDSLRDLQPRVVLFPISIYYIALHAREMLHRLREMLPEAVLVTGGIYATLHSQEIMEDGAADFVVRGEGEWTTLELLRALLRGERDFSRIDGLTWRDGDGRIIHNPDRERERDLDRFPHIYTVSGEFRIADRHRLLKSLNPFDDYIPGAGFLTSRGCPEQCTFCLDPAVWKRRTRFHSPAYVREVLDYCWEHFTEGERSFYFGDATFALNRPRLRALLETVREVPYAYHIQTRADSLTPEVLRGLRESNFRTVALGAESFDDRVLREVVKKRTTREEILSAARAAREHGLTPILTFIAGLPGESRKSLERTVEILREEGIREATFF